MGEEVGVLEFYFIFDDYEEGCGFCKVDVMESIIFLFLIKSTLTSFVFLSRKTSWSHRLHSIIPICLL